jgi:hypothetical protein
MAFLNQNFNLIFDKYQSSTPLYPIIRREGHISENELSNISHVADIKGLRSASQGRPSGAIFSVRLVIASRLHEAVAMGLPRFFCALKN